MEVCLFDIVVALKAGCNSTTFPAVMYLLFCSQANAQLPAADTVIVVVSAELIANASGVSQQLAIATEAQEGSLLPLDLNATNNVVSQVIAWSHTF